MTKLGTRILTAMRDQGWLVVVREDDDGVEYLHTISTLGGERLVPTKLLKDESLERKLRIILMAWIVVDGLWWPWPPDHEDGIHGEQPRGE